MVQLTEEKIGLFFDYYRVAPQWIEQRFTGGLDLFLDDPLVHLIIIDCWLQVHGNQANCLEDFFYQIATSNGGYQIAGEISVDEFFTHARRLVPGHILNLPPQPCYEEFLQEFLAVGLPIYETDPISKKQKKIADQDLQVFHFVEFINRGYNFEVLPTQQAKMIVNREHSLVISKKELRAIASSHNYIQHLLWLYGYE